MQVLRNARKELDLILQDEALVSAHSDHSTGYEDLDQITQQLWNQESFIDDLEEEFSAELQEIEWMWAWQASGFDDSFSYTDNSYYSY